MEALEEHIFVYGSIVDTEGLPVENATIDMWQAKAAGKYRQPHDSNLAPADEKFQGWAIV
ncbi:MAG: protocatechuate 3,4-dioxygenase beta subunit [Pseudomonadales bacterium]|jgi:protocatechuate 3,4-dioxygenase beta subunit